MIIRRASLLREDMHRMTSLCHTLYQKHTHSDYAVEIFGAWFGNYLIMRSYTNISRVFPLKCSHHLPFDILAKLLRYDGVF